VTFIDGVEVHDAEHPEGAYEIGSPRERPSHLRVAPKTSRDVLRRRRRARFAVLGVAALSAASMFLLVAFHVFAVQAAFQLDKFEGQLQVEQRKYALLRSEVDAASSPETVATKAEAMGMERSRNVKVLPLETPAFAPKSDLPAPSVTPNAARDTTDSGP
jgi:cell division protein FtsL